MRVSSIGLYCVAGVAALAVGWIDFNLKGDDIYPSLLLVGLPAMILGAIRPRHAAGLGITVGLGVPAIRFAAKALGLYPAYQPQPNDWASFLALAPALVASLVGAGIGMLLPQPAVEKK